MAEEIETLARADRREIRDQLVVLCAHLLKWRFRPDVRLRIAILEARDKIAELIEESPNLAPYPAAQLGWAYVRGRREAETDTGLLDLPPECPWDAIRSSTTTSGRHGPASACRSTASSRDIRHAL